MSISVVSLSSTHAIVLTLPILLVSRAFVLASPKVAMNRFSFDKHTVRRERILARGLKPILEVGSGNLMLAVRRERILARGLKPSGSAHRREFAHESGGNESSPEV